MALIARNLYAARRSDAGANCAPPADYLADTPPTAIAYVV
jgi:hypothetical protein